MGTKKGHEKQTFFCHTKFMCTFVCVKISLLCPFKVGLNKRIILPQSHSQNILLNDYYIYEIIYLVDFLSSLNIHILLD